MKSLWSQNLSGKVKSWDVKEHIAVLYPDVVVCVEVYHNIRKWSKIQEFLVLGHQTLSEPKNKMYCLTDQLMLKAGLHDPSGYFLIEVRNPVHLLHSCGETFLLL
ncbi:snRNA-activating protein complex subunit-like isoform X2 [Durio zibethinus]|uniref:snRNA-activating protein complex subunit-like isoform X2 n=1 Tax=Durio zibethinus TaxID=66656 RepID=A0A6P6BEW3_DURZI|nr:snRNA-activating protein complex subunit-like isoform X2 [Durio zibethinus]